MTTELINFKLLESAVADIEPGKICIESSPDSDLGYVMMGCKDYAGLVQKLLAKNNPAYISTLRITALSGTSGFVTHDASGDISGSTITGAELNSFISDEDVVFESAFDSANTILKADTASAPIPLTVPVSTIVGRKATGYIDALTASEAKDILATTLQDTYDNSGVVQLSSGDPLDVADLDGESVLHLSSTSNEGAITNVNSFGTLEGYSSTTTIEGETLNLNDGTYSTTLTEIVEEIAANTSDISDLQIAVNRSLTPNVITFSADDQNADFLATDAYEQLVEGDYSNCSMDLPAAIGVGMFVGWSITVVNISKDFKHIYNNDKTKVFHIPPRCESTFRCYSVATMAGMWNVKTSQIDDRDGVDLRNNFHSFTSDYGAMPMRHASSGTGANVFIPAIYENGRAFMSTGTTTTGKSYMYVNADKITLQNGPVGMYVGIAPNLLSNGTDDYRVSFGLVDDVTRASVTKEIGFVYDYANNGGDQSYYAIEKNTGGSATTDLNHTPTLSGVSTVITAGDRLSMFTSSDGTKCCFWIGNTYKTTLSTFINPADSFFLHAAIEKISGTSDRFWVADSIGKQRIFNTERW